MKPIKTKFIAGFSMFMFCCFPFVYPQPSIGTITFLEGAGDITRDNQEPISLKENDNVFINDRIRTKSYSKVQITFADKSVVKLAPGSCITIEDFRMSPNQKRELARLKLTRGKLEAIVAKTGKPETFVIDTPNAKGAVKGSDIFVSYLAGKTGVFVKEGALLLNNPALPDTKTTILKGNCTFVPFNEAPQNQRRMLDAEMLIHKRDVERELIKKWIPSKTSSKMNAVIVATSGTVRIYKKGAKDWKDALKDDTFEEGDTLQTSNDGQATIRLNNGNTLLVSSNTELGVTTLRYDAKSGNFENTFAVARGKVGAVVEKLSKESTFQLKTPTVVCGVRGTLLEVVVADQTQVFYEGGSGVVTNLATGQTITITPGQYITIDPNGNIGGPFTTTDEQRSNLLVSQPGASSGTGTMAGISTTGSLDVQTEGGLVLAQESIAGADISALTNATQNMDLTSTLLSGAGGGSAASSTAAPIIVYSNSLAGFSVLGLATSPPGMSVKLYSDNTWTANTIVSGFFIGNTGSWDFASRAGSDILGFSGNDFPSGGQWNGTVTTGTVNGKTLTGSGSGSVVVNTQGPIDGTASGTWN